MVMSPNILEVMSFILSSNSNNCCLNLLYFNANSMCSFTKKLQLLGDPQSSFISHQYPVRSTPLGTAHDSCCTWRFRKSPSDREKTV